MMNYAVMKRRACRISYLTVDNWFHCAYPVQLCKWNSVSVNLGLCKCIKHVSSCKDQCLSGLQWK